MLSAGKLIIVLGHIQPGELLRLLKSNLASSYLIEGYQHILPYGYDHIAFIIGLLLLSPKLKPILWQATAFTIAHSITLGLAMYHIIQPPLNLVEPLIAISILYVAVENILSPKLRAFRIAIVFLFGLVHGLGFAGSLSQLNISHEHFFTCLIMFNLGVELGQLTVILIFYLLIARWFAATPYYRKYVVIPLSFLIAMIACFWIVQRVFYH
ncbi:HupE/UreJ family protein [Chitinophaga sancti]|uniref:HupE / UreJ protein n=1 Tax=Chitinophaga sancti TaxID=1004 RepID=A0A1K1RX38_9BACT|nr:HupE/UreJ family protein [Chitinophaga sancti]WQD64026.1 HupE/UreJ family protein [Chitinophaga sancti]WQG90350.1 HupE/UreJ family protein [Chitinophaga sancti]SFW76598.1 HupE / UreJ protein [Chitinophaga sancti]